MMLHPNGGWTINETYHALRSPWILAIASGARVPITI